MAGIIALFSLTLTTLVALPQFTQAYTTHAPISIDGNAGFTPANGVTGGNGTASDPYIIEGWQIDASTAHGIMISNTDSYATIRGVYVHSGGVDFNGIFLDNVSNIVVEGGTFLNNNFGIVAFGSSSVTIANNTVSDSFWEGIIVESSYSVTVRGNDVQFSQDYGIDIFTSSYVEVRDNTATTATYGIYLDSSDHVFVSGNNASSNVLLGIAIDYSFDITLINNSMWDNDNGIDLFASDHVMVRQNTVGMSMADGAYIYYSSNVTLDMNRLVRNDDGVFASFATDLTVAHNIFDGNFFFQGGDEFGTRTAWDLGYPAGGNYYSDYTGPDNCSGPAQDVCPDPDGIGDVPYSLDSDTSDLYPLMSPWTANHSPIQISSNGGLTPSNGVTGGSGIASDPFVIDGWDIDSSLSHGILIANTDAYLVIRGVFVHSPGSQFINILLDNVTNVNVEGALLDGSGEGLSILNSSAVLAVDNWILKSYSDCVRVANSTSVSLTGGFLSSCKNWGINAFASSYLDISGNRISNGAGGISLHSNDRIVIAGNNLAANNLRGPGAGIALSTVSNLTVEVNELLRNRQGMVLDDLRDAVIQQNTVTGSTIEAVSIANSNNVTFAWNNFTLGGGGVSAAFTNNLTVAHNGIVSNSGDGILLRYCGDVNVTGNDISYNGRYGLNSNASNILVVHNDFWLNAVQAYDDASGTSSWNDSYQVGGNYWSNYTGSDSMSGPNQDQPGGDGFGDTPLLLQGGSNKDMYPLMQPSIPRPTPDLTVPPSSVWFNPPSPIPEGSFVTINTDVWNIGSGTSGPSVVRFFEGVPPSPQIDLDQPLASISVGSFAGVSAVWTPSGVGNHTVCIFADPDNIVAETDETNNMACIDVEVVFSIDLAPGHRFISFPLVVNDESVWNVLSPIWGCFDYVRWYDPTDVTSPWKSYVPGRGFDSLHRLNNTMGFWLDVISTCTFTPAGVKPSSTNVVLRQGWNMVGFPSFNTSYTVANLKADIGLNGIIVEAFDMNAGPSNLQRVNDGYVMTAGEGYWIFVPSDATWMISG